jgi:heme/copper-type cytochrome/quinol oxidase subunit 4
VTPFEYLSVLISVIVGLGLSHLLTGVARMIQLRRRVRPHLTTLLWVTTLFLAQVEVWWVFYDTRRGEQWNFFLFLVNLIIPVLVFLLCYLIVPDLDAETLDLRESFFANRVWFFGIISGAWAFTFIQDLARGGLHLDVFRAFFLALSLVGMLVRNERYHLVNAALSLALFCAYVAAEFMSLA